MRWLRKHELSACFPLFLIFIDMLLCRSEGCIALYLPRSHVCSGCWLLPTDKELRHSFLPLSLHSWQLNSVSVLWWESSLFSHILITVHVFFQFRVLETGIMSLPHKNFGQFLKMPCYGVKSLVSSLISKPVVLLGCPLAPTVASTQCKLGIPVRPDSVGSLSLLLFLR